jgi:hypothetical protein
MNLEPLRHQINLARIALDEAKRIEEENDYDDALISMDRSYCEGSLEALEFAYVLLNGVPYDEQ